ncbi:MAG: sugar phosphate nucleotidyltransferase [Verrucomicrobiota bacterium JB022]|nr:sugar phosphate nucleotidyltransferase [Verrucomicrobiota bacterium JB022]
MSSRYVVIMAGGKGERFWPQSRLERPKHLLPIVGDEPMLTQTILRLGEVVPPERVIIITNQEQRDAVLEVCPMLSPENVIGEPMPRDTAAAVGLAAVLVKHRDPQATFAMLPADHVIHDAEGFQSVVSAAFTAAEQAEALVTVGIQPDHPATGYGYIQREGSVDQAEGRDVFGVKEFKEKPDEATAQRYVDSGDYYWNAGMFFWTVPVIAQCFASYTPDLWKALQAIEKGLEAGQDLGELLAERYPKLEKISVDYAIMEPASNENKVRVVESDFDWDDVGEWPSIARHYPADDSGNVVRGSLLTHEANDNIVVNEKGHLTALVGVDNLIVVQTGDATLIVPRDRAQDVKKLVQQLGKHPEWKHLS